VLKTRQMLGKYRIQKRLAEGGFATVYKGLDTVEGVPVAIKVPYPQFLDREALALFRKEVRLTASLDHPNILPVKNAQFIDDHFVIIYPLGVASLADRMKRRLTTEKALRFVEQMLEAVAHAHRRRIVHCDVKPDNFILFPGERLRLGDFGISRVAYRTLTASGSGTVGYLSPDQALGKPSLRSDVFSLGLIIYELLSGRLPRWPFDWPPAGIERVQKKVHPDFIAWLERALSVWEIERFENAQKMLAAFQRLKAKRRLLAPDRRRKSVRKKATKKNNDWKAVQRRLFLRQFRTALGARFTCSHCHGPVSEPMQVCPWCGRPRKVHREATAYPARCPRCRRGRKLDWKFCAWCYGPAFRKVAAREYSDARYDGRCASPRCRRKQLVPFSRYCPWCRTKVRRRWPVPGSRDHCGKCGWGVVRDYWAHCPWCGHALARGGRR